MARCRHKWELVATLPSSEYHWCSKPECGALRSIYYLNDRYLYHDYRYPGGKKIKVRRKV